MEWWRMKMKQTIIQRGMLGLNSPKRARFNLITICEGIKSRTGRATGHVDEGHCVEVTAWDLPGEYGERTPVSTERLYAPDRYEPESKNRIGTLGAYANQRPAESEVEAAVERARATLDAGAVRDMLILCVAAETG